MSKSDVQEASKEPLPDADEVDRAFKAISDALVAAGVSDSTAGSCALMVSAAIARVQGLKREAFMAIAGGAWDSAGHALDGRRDHDRAERLVMPDGCLDCAEFSRTVAHLAEELGHARLQMARDLPMMAATIAAGCAPLNELPAHIASKSVAIARAILAELATPEAK